MIPAMPASYSGTELEIENTINKEVIADNVGVESLYSYSPTTFVISDGDTDITVYINGLDLVTDRTEADETYVETLKAKN